jgi:hypothetical protein
MRRVERVGETAPHRRSKPSPDYPLLNVEQALVRIGRIYNAEGSHPVPALAVVRALGYTSLHGSGKRLLATLKQYKLLATCSEGCYVVTAATRIILRQDEREPDPRRQAALRRVALSPPVFTALFQEFGEQSVAETTQRAFLIKHGFQPEAARHVLGVYHQTLDYLHAETTRSDALVSDAVVPQGARTASSPSDPSARHPEPVYTTPVPPPERTYWLPLGPMDDFRLSVRGRATKETFITLQRCLSLIQSMFPEEGEEPEADQRTARTAP